MSEREFEAALGPQGKARLLVCDDEAGARRGIVRALGRQRYELVECASGLECLEELESQAADLVLLDLRMPGLDGRATLERIMKRPLPPPVVVVTADASLRSAIDSVRAGATDFLAKPYEIDELRWVVERTLASVRLRRENRELREDVRRLRGSGEVLGESPAMEELFAALERVGPATVSVLLRGETGTGKELVARRLHQLSAAARGPFVAVNCAAVPESLLESELFGHRKGAFTGADRDRAGRFQQAHGGTLFLDEIGDMPAPAQAKLLRVLQDGVVEPLGGGKATRVEVRVLSATHRDLEAMCREGGFRQDLYFRLRVVELPLPPLRERGDDVLLLTRELLSSARLELAPEAAAALCAYRWPGNVRELRNAVERAAIFCRDGLVRLDDLPTEIRGKLSARGPAASGSSGTVSAGTVSSVSVSSEALSSETSGSEDFQTAKQRVVESFERAYFDELLRAHAGNVSAAARAAGVHRQNLQKKLRQLGLDPAAFRGAP